MEYKEDTYYVPTNMELQMVEQSRALDALSQSFSNTKLQSINEYRMANDILKRTYQINVDLGIIRSGYRVGYQETQLQPTNIDQNIRQIFAESVDILKGSSSQMSDKAYSQFTTGLQVLDRLHTNLFGHDKQNIITKTGQQIQFRQQVRLPRYSIEQKIWDWQKDINDKVLSRLRYEQQIYKMGVKLDVSNLQIKVPEEIVAHTALQLIHQAYNFIPAGIQIFDQVDKAIQASIGALDKQSSQLQEFGNLFKDPIGAIVGICAGMNGFATGFMQIWGIAFSTIPKVQEPLLRLKFGKSKGDDKSVDSMLGSIFASIGMMITNLVSNLVNIIFMAITTSIDSFISIMKAMKSLLKQIQDTSPIIKAILEYVSLACNLVFFYFFTALGEPILEKLMQFMAVLVTNGVNLGNQYDDIARDLTGNNELWANTFDNIKIILENLMENIIPIQAQIIPPIMEFIEKFVDVLISNAGLIDDMLNAGISAYNQLVQGGIELLIKEGVSAFEWIGREAETICQIFNLVMCLLSPLFDFIGWQMDNIEIFIIAQMGLFGALQGALIGYRAQTIAQALTLGIAQLGIPGQILIGQISGGVIGAAIGWGIVHEFIDPVAIDGLQETIPSFASGGKIRHKGKGLLSIMGEAGEGEFIIPESKTKLFRGENNVIIRINGKVYKEDNINRALKELKGENDIKVIMN